MAKYMLGSARHQIDDKGRVRIPAKFREGLGATSYIIPGRVGCIYIIPEARFEEVLAKFMNDNPYANDATNDLFSELMAISGALEEDAQGRVRISQEIIQTVSIKKELVFVGKGIYVEVWPAEVWDSKHNALNPDNLNKIIEKLKSFGV